MSRGGELRKEEIKSIVRSRQLPFLVHFTQLDNLPSILENGFLCRDLIPDGVAINDEIRLDGRRNTVSLSISFPNHRMFFKYRQEKQGGWCVLAINIAVLWELDCLFCKHNAADGRISCLSNVELASPEALRNMFDEIEGLEGREEQRLKVYDPTDPQAEVLVNQSIPACYIHGIAFPDRPSKDQYQHLSGHIKLIEQSRNKGYFASRSYVRR
ncbi:DUF4433 domain-containing protein [Halomonas litopenaei]|nr:DUF4433 domain-containing protein [Halomonas litopenaei]